MKHILLYLPYPPHKKNARPVKTGKQKTAAFTGLDKPEKSLEPKPVGRGGRKPGKENGPQICDESDEICSEGRGENS